MVRVTVAALALSISAVGLQAGCGDDRCVEACENVKAQDCAVVAPAGTCEEACESDRLFDDEACIADATNCDELLDCSF